MQGCPNSQHPLALQPSSSGAARDHSQMSGDMGSALATRKLREQRRGEAAEALVLWDGKRPGHGECQECLAQREDEEPAGCMSTVGLREAPGPGAKPQQLWKDPTAALGRQRSVPPAAAPKP